MRRDRGHSGDLAEPVVEGGGGPPDPHRIRGPSTRGPVLLLALVLGAIVTVGVGSRLSGPAGTAAQPTAPGRSPAADVHAGTQTAETASTSPLLPSTPEDEAAAVASTTFWLVVDRPGHPTPRIVPVQTAPDGTRTVSINVPAAWSAVPRHVRLLGQTHHGDAPTTLLVVRIGRGATSQHSASGDLAHGMTWLVDPLRAAYSPSHWRFADLSSAYPWRYEALLERRSHGEVELVIHIRPGASPTLTR